MDLLLAPTLVNVFFLPGKIWLQNCPFEFKLVIYRRSDAILFFCLKHLTKKFQDFLNLQHENIRFTSETKTEKCTLLLDINIDRYNNNKFID